jgi:photosystem II stability/assembly factor-like uncharacterized protein
MRFDPRARSCARTPARAGFRRLRIIPIGTLCVGLLAFPNLRSPNPALHPARSPGERAVQEVTWRMASSRQTRFSLPALFQRARAESARYDHPLEAQQFYARKRVPPGMTAIPVEKYLEALRHMDEMPQYATALGMNLPSRREMAVWGEVVALSALGVWEELGPGNIGGRTRALLIHPTDPRIMYAGAVSGGVWKTTDGGRTWVPLDDLLPNLAVCALAMDPRNPDVIYAGTGEGYFNVDAVRGAGIFMTTDGGRTWTHLASTRNENFYYVNDIVISPNDSRRIYAATRTGVWRSRDGGQSWTRILARGGRDGCLDLALRTDRTTDYLFASCGNFSRAAVYRNMRAEGGGSWTLVLSEPDMGRTSLALAPSDQNVVYALAASLRDGPFRYGLHAVYRSTRSGDPGSWIARVRFDDGNKLNTVLLSNPVFAFLSECGYGPSDWYNQGWYDNVIAVDPRDPNRVWVGGIDLFRSDDGGQTWGIASYWWAETNDPQYVHADHHVIVFHPQYDGVRNRTMFVGTDGGVFRTEDARAPVARGPGAACRPTSGFRWQSLNDGYATVQFYHGLPFPDGRTYFGGTQDNGTVLGNEWQGANGWREIFGGDGGYVAVDPENPSVLYVTNPEGWIEKSQDGGVSFRPVVRGLDDEGFEFIAPLVMDPNTPRRLWTGGWYLWRTDDGAETWQRASRLTPGDGSVTAIAVAPGNSNIVIAGMSDGYILRTTDALRANAETAWAFTRPRAGFVSSVAFDPTNPRIVYATYSTFGGPHVWKSTDGGATWRSIDGQGSGRVPDLPVHVLVVDPNDPQRLYIGTDLGVFVSLNGGVSWAIENTGFANVVTEALTVGRVGTLPSLFAFTHGRGAWRVPIIPFS